MIDDCHFKFIVKSYGHHYTSAQKVEIINRFSWMYWTGKVDLEHPEQIFWILEYVDVNKLSNAPLPRQIWFTRQISRGCRHLVNKYSLSNRKYLGTTSMEAEIAFLSANQALARPGSLILDPFVGTGSLIVACAHFRAYTIGTDIDRKVLDGLSADECIESNFAQYNLTQQFLGCIQLDMSFFNALYLGRSRFDAIICDPPYGIRAGARKIGVRPQRELRHKNRGTDPAPIHVNPNDPNWLPHVPQCIAYHIEDVLKDLVELAANLLVLHGRLVYWLPTTKEYSQSDLPTHPCLLLISDSEQKLTMNWSRRLITMEKISDYKPSLSKPNPRHNLPTHANIAFKVLKDPSRCRKVELSEE
ncbi:tRNA (guanine(10)-N2)-methyltransferase homolog isoform X2 [Schistocerca gregaria]|nr:tRNA (guanine(10)-N2)-methyltransferase homolog isoform X2 [Schistocerca gregaria]